MWIDIQVLKPEKKEGWQKFEKGELYERGGASKREIRHLENCGYRGKKDLYCADLHKIHVKQVDTPFLDPPSGPMYPGPSVCQSVCPSVRHKSSHTSRHYFFLIFCNKLACSKCRKVMKLDFRRKIRRKKFCALLCPKMRFFEVFGDFLENAWLDSAEK